MFLGLSCNFVLMYAGAEENVHFPIETHIRSLELGDRGD